MNNPSKTLYIKKEQFFKNVSQKPEEMFPLVFCNKGEINANKDLIHKNSNTR